MVGSCSAICLTHRHINGIDMRWSALFRLSAYAFDTGLSALFGLVLLLLAARGSELSEFGLFALALAVAGIQTPLAVLGTAALFYGRAASRPLQANRLYWPGIATSLVSGTLLYLLTLLVLWFVSSPELVTLYALAGLRVVGALGEPLRAIYQARSRPMDYVPWRVLTLMLAFAASGFAFTNNAQILAYAAIWGLEWLVFASILLVLSLRRGICPRSKRTRVRSLLLKASPLFVQSVCVAIYLRFDQVYVGWRFGETDVGIYAAAARTAEAGNMVYGLIALVVAPRIIREWLSGKLSVSSRAVIVLIGYGSLAASGFSLLYGEELLRIAFGPAFMAGAMILAIYVLSTCLTVYGTIGSRLNIAQGATMPSMISGLVGAISNIGLTIALCEIQGPLGAATATVLSYLIAVVIIWKAASAGVKR